MPVPELGRDDHGERGLAEPGRAGQQHVVRRAAAPPGALQHQRDLLAHPLLADELVEPPGAQRRLDDPLLVAGAGLAPAPARRTAGQLGQLAGDELCSSARLIGPRPSRASASRSSAGTSASAGVGWLAGEADDDLVGLRGGPAEPDQRLRQRVAPAGLRPGDERAPRRRDRPCP